MRILRFGWAIVTLVAGSVWSSQAQESTSPNRAAALSTGILSDCSGIPCVDVAVENGKHLRLAIDTGNPTSFLTAKAASSLILKQEPVLGKDGKPVSGFTSAVVPSVLLGSGSLGDLKFAVFDLSASIQKSTFPGVDGTLVYGAFRNRILQLDHREHMIGYSAPLPAAEPCPVAECGKISLITFGKNGPPIVTATGFTVNGKPLQVQVDTMYSGTLLVYPTSVEKLGLQTQSGSKQTRYFSFTDEGVDMFEAKGVDEGFAGKTLLRDVAVYFAGPKVHLPDGLFDGTVGAQLFADHRVTMDFKSMNLWID